MEGLNVVIVNPGVILAGELWGRSTATLFRDVCKWYEILSHWKRSSSHC